MAPGGGGGGASGGKDDESVPVLGRPPASLDMPFNPFYSDGAAISTAYEVAKTALLLPVAVLRLLLWALCIAFGFLFVKAALLGARDTLTKPFQPWRRLLLLPVRLVARLLLFACGFQWISVKGRPAPRHVAPILVCNHVTFADPVFAFAMHLPIAVTAQENVEYPIVGAIMRAMQVITVDRGERESRKKAGGEIKRRAMCNDWNRVIVFPEATTTNGKSLVSFKLGAFSPGFAVQPIVFRYPHVHLNPSWCAAGPSVTLLLFRLMTQFHNFMQVEYLPVIEPTPRELDKNPTLFAERVRMSMARVLNATVTEHSFEDVALILAAQKLGDGGGEAVIEFGKFERLFRLTPKEAKELYAKFSSGKNRSTVLFYENFVQMLGLPDCEPVLRVFSSMDQYQQGFINFRQYTAWAAFISRHHMLHEVVESSFQFFDHDEDGFLSKDDIKLTLKSLIPDITSEHVQRLWDKMISTSNKGDVTFISKPEFILFFQSNPEYPAVVLYARPNLLSSFRELDSKAKAKQR